MIRLTDVKVLRERGNIFQPVIDRGREDLSTKRRIFVLNGRNLEVQSQSYTACDN